MGNKDNYRLGLDKQIQNKFNNMVAFGESKRQGMTDNSSSNKIYSYNTLETYQKHGRYFANYMGEKHPNVTNLKKASAFKDEFLDERKKQGVSPYTLHLENATLNKLFGITAKDKGFYKCPPRTRENISRSRGDAERDKHFSKTNNADLINFCQGTGLRRSELQSLKKGDLWTKDDIAKKMHNLESKGLVNTSEYKALKDTELFGNKEYFVHVANGKGGKERFAPITDDKLDKVLDRFNKTNKGDKVFRNVHNNADIHGYRGDYAKKIYKENERDLEKLKADGKGKEIYNCRKDEKGLHLDKKAMERASKALGHNRIDVIARNYMYGL